MREIDIQYFTKVVEELYEAIKGVGINLLAIDDRLSEQNDILLSISDSLKDKE